MKPYDKVRRDDANQVIAWDRLVVNSRSSPRVRGKIQEQFNPFSMNWQKGSNVTLYYRKNGSPDTYWDGPGGVTGYNAASAPDVSDAGAVNNLKIAFLNQLNGESANLVDLVRTRKETISMVARNAMSIAKAVRFLKKGKLKRAMNELGITKEPKSKTAANRWLEMQYGWLPLLGDIHTMINGTFSDPVCFLSKSRTFSKSISSTVSRSYPIKHEVKRMQKTRVRFWCHFRIDAPALAAADQIGLLNPAITAWEAVPWSFVVDWFLPVGDWLETFTNLKGLKILEFGKSITSTENAAWSAKLDSGHTAIKGGKGESFAKSKVRLLDTTQVSFPSFENPLSLGHFYNAMALLRTSFKR